MKFDEPVTLEATYRIVTPMFLGDFDRHARQLSAGSIKGALRFWWRALNWARIRTEITNDDAALQQLHQNEAAIFGLASNDQLSHKSLFTLHVETPSKLEVIQDWPPSDPNNSSAYLGYGLTGGSSSPHRDAFKENQKFQIKLLLGRSLSPEQQESVRDALIIWGLLGGLGSRARRGFGSVAMDTLGNDSWPILTQQTWQDKLNTICAGYRVSELKELPPFTAFSKYSVIKILNVADNPRKVHASLGGNYKDFRKSLPRADRVPFGLPLKDEENVKRRASPCMFHIHPISKEYVAAAIYLPSKFHHQIPQGDAISYFDNIAKFIELRRHP
ncbi:MAG: type III-B CRISPR module RAMP protein Cmr1 [Pseudomonadales bacterium]|nr:type III-B CRISPR module RAMP protein Cmr1 [Pseudomonadales bacterium]